MDLRRVIGGGLVRPLRQFTLNTWLLGLIYALHSSCFYSFVAFATEFFTVEYGYSVVEAGRIASLANILFFSFSPVFGLLADFFGKRPYFMMLGVTGELTSVLLVAIRAKLTSYAITAFLGFSVSMVQSTLFPSQALITNPECVGLAYSVMSTMSNTGLALTPLAIGFLHDATNGYTAGFGLLMGLAAAAFVIAVVIKLYDCFRMSNTLDDSKARRMKKQEIDLRLETTPTPGGFDDAEELQEEGGGGGRSVLRLGEAEEAQIANGADEDEREGWCEGDDSALDADNVPVVVVGVGGVEEIVVEKTLLSVQQQQQQQTDNKRAHHHATITGDVY